MIGLFFAAAVLGVIITVMEEGEFPGWVPMLICVLAAIVPAAALNALIPAGLFFVGTLAGAVCCGCAISATCGMTVKRACIAAGIFFVIQLVISIGLVSMF